jgi:hypothetical protein
MTPHDAIVAVVGIAGCLFVLYLVGKATKFLLKVLAWLILALAVGAVAWWFLLGGREEFQQRQLRQSHSVTLAEASTLVSNV